MARRKKMTRYRVELPLCTKFLGIPRVCYRYAYSEKQALRAVFEVDGGYPLDPKEFEGDEKGFNRRLYAAYKDMQSQINEPGSKIRIEPYVRKARSR